MKEYEAECACCGMIMNRYWMMEISTGRNVRYLCPACYKNGQRQVDHVAYRPGRPARREAENK